MKTLSIVFCLSLNGAWALNVPTAELVANSVPRGRASATNKDGPRHHKRRQRPNHHKHISVVDGRSGKSVNVLDRRPAASASQGVRNASGAVSAFYSSGVVANSSSDQPEMVFAVTAAALGAAAAHRAVGAGRDAASELYAHGNPFNLDNLLKPGHSKKTVSSDAVKEAAARAARRSTANEAVDGAVPEKGERDAIRQDSLRKHDVADDSTEEGNPWDRRPKSNENASDGNMWPATDVIPMKDPDADDNETLVTPRPLTWEQTETPPEPFLFLPLVVLGVGLVCLLLVYMTSDRFRPQLDGSVYITSGDGLASVEQAGGPSQQAKLDAIFTAADRNGDGFISFTELAGLARLTNPSGVNVTQQWFCDLCRPLGADPQRGLDRQEFRRTYELLGIDVDKDYEALRRASRIGQAVPGVTHAGGCSDGSGAGGRLLERAAVAA